VVILREALIVVGIVMMLGAGMAILWSSIELRNLERAQDVLDEWGEWEWYPYSGFVDAETERLHDYYSAVRIVGVIGLIAGAIIALYGFLFLKEEPKPSSMAPSTPQMATGATNYCEYCGQQISPGAVWCPGCGRKFKPQEHEVNREQEVR